jgi:putative spermidine/putrescine transport system substrate-binding protein
MDKIQKGGCKRYHGDAPASYFNTIKFWKTPIADCGNGKTDCTDYTVWQQKWQEIKG